MSVVAWDGKTLAADCQATNAELRIKVSKIMRYPKAILAFTGGHGTGLVMVQWWLDGADLGRYPATQTKDEWSRLIVLDTVIGEAHCYEQFPARLDILEAPMAWGSGRDYAMGAMAMGADARRAVEIASLFSTECGLGVEAYDLPGVGG